VATHCITQPSRLNVACGLANPVVVHEQGECSTQPVLTAVSVNPDQNY